MLNCSHLIHKNCKDNYQTLISSIDINQISKNKLQNSQQMLQEQSSLVKYSTPVLVSASSKVNQAKKAKKEQQLHHTEDILGEILPPKEHQTDNGQLWMQTVLSTPATKIEVIQLHQQLNKRLNAKQAKQIGICPIREDLYDQCFDEVIRQITIDCRQRGLLLVRVRDEYRNQTKAYKKLYQSSINHGMRRVVESEQQKAKMSSQIAQLERECNQLDRNVEDLVKKIQTTKQKQTEKIKASAQEHKKKIDEIKQSNQKLKIQIQNAIQKKL